MVSSSSRLTNRQATRSPVAEPSARSTVAETSADRLGPTRCLGVTRGRVWRKGQAMSKLAAIGFGVAATAFAGVAAAGPEDFPRTVSGKPDFSGCALRSQHPRGAEPWSYTVLNKPETCCRSTS